MEKLFLKILSMSTTAVLVILAVLLIRLLLRCAPKVFSYALWAVVLFRLLCPFAIQTPWSMTPSIQVESASERLPAVEIDTERAEVIIRVDDPPADGADWAPPVLAPGEEWDTGADLSTPKKVAEPSSVLIAACVWLTGAVFLLGYSVLSMLRLRQKLVGSVPLEGEENVRLADHIPSPFVLGVLRPKIYLPSDLPEGEGDYILLHERTHIRRCDHIFRALAWLALSIHWFNPLVWLAFHLAGKDMEMSCDETVLRKMGRDVRADYATSLLRLSTGKRLPAGPLAFGDGDPKSRIKNVLDYKKPALWVIVIALVAVVCAGAALATNPGSFSGPGEPQNSLSYAVNERWDGVVITGKEAEWAEQVEWYFPIEDPFDVDAVYARLGHMGAYGVTLDGGWTGNVYGFWTSEDRNAVKLQLLHLPQVLGYTVVLDAPKPVIIERSVGSSGDGDVPLSDEEIVELAEHFAQCLRPAEIWYEQQIQANGTVLNDLPTELTLSLAQSPVGRPYVSMDGTVLGHTLGHTTWWPPYGDWEELYDGYRGLTMEYTFESGGNKLYAWWADESRTSVTVSTEASLIGVSMIVDWWEFTVDLSNGQGAVISMETKGREGSRGDPVTIIPEVISNQEAVKAAQVAAKLLTAAEDWYLRQQRTAVATGE